MPADIWFISDTHFGHEKICTFKTAEGKPLRPFESAAEMDEKMVELWNARVKPQDKVYHLGDVVITKRNLPTMGRLNGSHRLIRGNHDVFRTKEYLEFFKEVYGVRVMTEHRLILSHIPLHADSVPRFGWNVHGHLHSNLVTRRRWQRLFLKEQDPRYISVCVEHTDFAPMHLDEVLAKRKAY